MRNRLLVILFFILNGVPLLVGADQLSGASLFQKKQLDKSRYSAFREIQKQKSICGPTNDLQHVNQYDGSAGQGTDFVNQFKSRVGAMSALNTNDSRGKYCSGTLIGPDLFLTASHCIGVDVLSHFVVFNYEIQTGQPVVLLPQDFYKIVEVVEDSLEGLDYAIIRLEGAPGHKYGYADVSPSKLTSGQPLTIIQHPKGQPKQVDSGHYLRNQGNYLTYNDLDTEPGSSGSGILDSSGLLVGVHTNGGCTSSVNSMGNQGVRMSKIIEASGLL